MSETTRTFIATESDAGMRLDKFLALRMPEFSRTEIQDFRIAKISGDRPQVTGDRLKLSNKIKPGEEYSVEIQIRSTNRPLPVANHDKISLDILHEDDDIIVVNKPRGIAMHPGAGRDSGTLVQMVLGHTNLSHIGGDTRPLKSNDFSGAGGMRPGVVHRLDKDTSGIVVLAKSDAAFRALSKTFAAHDIVRKYIAFVWGVPNWGAADITGNIGRAKRNRQKMTMVKVGGKEAKTHLDVINAWPRAGVSALRCTLFTGRTHQIRVHLSAHGFPVLCDPVYGRGGVRLGTVRNPELLEFLKTHNGQMLHAEVLEFAHPLTGAALKFHAKLPDDMTELKEILQNL
ncbi:MAG: RluA family pseudouridine synthase [Proteobacteria bacterium]|nr:RluA family pseudouridine synthase [Pseudomonadota bacterium]